MLQTGGGSRCLRPYSVPARHGIWVETSTGRPTKICPHRHGRHTAVRCAGTGAAWAHLLASQFLRLEITKCGAVFDGPAFRYVGLTRFELATP
jgi:hypothetical protein